MKPLFVPHVYFDGLKPCLTRQNGFDGFIDALTYLSFDKAPNEYWSSLNLLKVLVFDDLL